MKPTQSLNSSVVLLFAVACGLAVGNVYYAQPLLDAMADAFGMNPATIGIVVTLTQVGYGVGLLLLVPLGDLLNRRRLIVTQTLLSALALLMIALAQSSVWLLIGMALTGLLAVVTQVLVAYAATLAIPAQRGR
ncbi:MFS transporter, partial [Pseudomonas sp. 43NM1]|uniref:MFS transporter n=1 Tax=Pseudomonas sp. 43NM1 TaxID=1904755 RepID=UPI0012FF16FE